MLSRNLIIFLCLACCTTIVNARMYKWVDDEGITQYSQSPPPKGYAKEIAPPPLPSATRKLNEADKEEPKPEAKTKPKEATVGSDKQEGPTKKELAESEALRKENCDAVKSNLDLYTNVGNKLIKTPGGLYKRLTEVERQAKLAETNKLVKEFCTK